MPSLKMNEKVSAGDNLLVDEMADFIWGKLLDEVELDEKEDANLSWSLNRFF